MNIDSTEFYRLCELLRNANVKYQTCIRTFAMGNDHQICIPSIEAWSKHNGINISINALTEGHNKGLLELWDGTHEPIGYLTAEHAFEEVQKAR